jgi:hypothetical protein
MARPSRVKPQERPRVNFDVDVAKFTERQISAVDMLDSGEKKFVLYGGALGGGKELLSSLGGC